MSTFYVQNFGCRATQADGASLERQLTARGLPLATQPEDAGVVVLNTCTVTAAADQDARAAIRRIHRENPECRILVTGCYAQRAPQELAALPGVRWVVGNSHKHQVAEIIGRDAGRVAGERISDQPSFVPLAAIRQTEANACGEQPAAGSPYLLVGDIFAHSQMLAAPVLEGMAGSGRTRANLKVQDGCDNRCSFCIIPSVRGRSRSLPLEEAVREVEALVQEGYREVVLSGINLGRWGRDLKPKRRFEELVVGILEGTGLQKLRLSSVEPMDWSDELISLVASHPRLARHAHLPLQSGSDRILRGMHRKYRPWHYAVRVDKIRAAAAEAAIGADVMTGFPGENEELFQENREFIAGLPFTYLHVFTFSARPGTAAASLPEQVPPQLARERTRILRALAAEKNFAFRRSLVGKTQEAITLHAHDGEFTEALTSNFLKLRLRGRWQANQWLQARITDVCEDGLEGAAGAE